MLEAKKFSANGEEIGKVTLPESIFAAESKNANAVLYEVINMYRANQRQGTSSVKSRGEVRGSTRKLFRQKGTGNARPGSKKTPVRVGGGVAHGPKPKNWVRHIPKKKKNLALRLALTERAKNNQIYIVESLNFDKPDTKKATELLGKIVPGYDRKLVVFDSSDKALVRSFTNVNRVETDRADGLFAYEILKNRAIVLTVDALKKVEEVFAK